jgi:glycosyltransferase involved in cell wall biosynthesis
VSKIQESNYHKLKAASKKYGLGEDELVITGYVPNKDLLSLYSVSSLFVFPSLHEGFGLPILEAMSCSAPAIGSNTTSIPEVLGIDEAMFDPYSVNSISEKIREVLENDTFREKLEQNAKEQIKLFSWDNSAKKALTAMENLVANNTTQKSSINSEKEIVKKIAEIYSDTKPDRGDMEQLAFCISANTPIKQGRQLLLDISMLAKADLRSGVQRVSRSILSEMLKMTNENFVIRPIYYDEKDKRYRYADRQASAIANIETGVNGNHVVDFRQGDIYLSLDITAHLTHILHGFYIYLRALEVEVYTLIYDILFANHPHWWVERVSKNLNVWFGNVVTASTGLICISDAVANDVSEWIRKNPPARSDIPMIKSFHLGADIENSAPSKGLPNDADTVLQLIRGKPSFLMVGTVEPRKGHYQTLKAFEILWAKGEDINLIIVGKEGWLIDKLVKELRNHPEKNRHLFWMEGISDEYLEKIYTASTCLIAASLGEGFGLPLIEAAQHKLPIIARNIPVFREVAGDYACYFDNAENAEMLADTIKNWIDQYKDDRHQRSDDMPWLTWEKSTKQLLEVINDLDQQVGTARA